MRFILGRAATREEVEAEWAERLGPRSDVARGLGYWVGFEEERFVGWWSASSFVVDPTRSGVGYRLVQDAWGRGLATEGGRALVAQAFSVPGVDRVVASTMAVNTASRAVLAKLGMTHVDTYAGSWADPLPGWEQGEVVYELLKEARIDEPHATSTTPPTNSAPRPGSSVVVEERSSHTSETSKR